MGSRITILGIGIDKLTMVDAIKEFQRLIERGKPSLAVNVNVDLCMKIQRDPVLQDIYRAADLVLVDGTPMMWAARLMGTPLPGRVSGSDFVPAFCQFAARVGYRVFLLGAGPGVAEQARRWLERRNPGLRIAGTYAPPMGFERVDSENARIIQIVRESRPHVLFAAFGPGKQERWLFRFRGDLQVPISMGIGSTFDYLAGRLKRAPLWMQSAGLEWTYRLKQEPRRLWRRYLLEDSPFVFHILKQRLTGQGRS